MPLVSLRPRSTPRIAKSTLSRTVAAARLEIHVAHVDKMIRAGMLRVPITEEAVADLRLNRTLAEAVDGELTVLRTDARTENDTSKYPDDPRRWMGFHVDHTDSELDETSLRWWRSDPARVLDNELLVVTVATYPVAVYRVTGVAESIVRVDEDAPRHYYAGTLLARVTAGMQVTYKEPLPGYLRETVELLMESSRVTVNSGGPIGYLDPALVD
jgi:hypothetical protein